MASSGYPIPSRLARVEIEVRRSRFIATLAHAETADDARDVIASVRAEFTDATHNCWAFQAGPPGDTRLVGMSDDGEPHGTAGKPMLNCLLHSGVGELVAVVTRYFGGTKLGKGGLVRAYTDAVNSALCELHTEIRVDRVPLSFAIGYTHQQVIEATLAEFEGLIDRTDYSDVVRFDVRVASALESAFRRALIDRTAAAIQFSGDWENP